jgi:hypothetical protein
MFSLKPLWRPHKVAIIAQKPLEEALSPRDRKTLKENRLGCGVAQQVVVHKSAWPEFKSRLGNPNRCFSDGDLGSQASINGGG